MTMLGKICAHIHNWFTDPEEIRAGVWTIENGVIDLSGILLDGQYFRIDGSALNDGVYQYPAECLIDENFAGRIWPMRVPRDFIELCEQIEAWQTKYGAAVESPYQSESVIGVYSYTKASGDGSGGTSGPTWETTFRAALNQWRKIR